MAEPSEAFKTVTISPRAAAGLAAGHPWVFRAELTDAEALTHGEPVVVLGRGPQGPTSRLGVAWASTTSQIALRMLGATVTRVDRGFLRARLLRALELRRRVLGPTLPQAFRWVHGEADGLPGLVVDRVGQHLSVQVLCQGTDRMQEDILEALWELGAPRSLVLRNDVPSRRKEGLPLGKQVWRGTGTQVAYMEGDVRLEVDLLEGQKTGTFLDQQFNHLLAGRLARGQALDCFSGDGGFALQMARHADHVVAVEMSAAAAARVAANAQANGLGNVEVLTGNAFEYLRDVSAQGPQFDAVVLDPPAFAKGRSSVAAALRGYKEINLRAMKLLAPGGLLVSCSCSQPVDARTFETMLKDAARDAGRRMRVVSRQSAGADHPTLPGFAQGQYLKCVVLAAL